WSAISSSFLRNRPFNSPVAFSVKVTMRIWSSRTSFSVSRRSTSSTRACVLPVPAEASMTACRSRSMTLLVTRCPLARAGLLAHRGFRGRLGRLSRSCFLAIPRRRAVQQGKAVAHLGKRVGGHLQFHHLQEFHGTKG